MAHTIKGKKALLARVRRIAGQVIALETALDSEQDCSVVLQQIASIKGAVNGLMGEVLEGHVRDHLGEKSQPEHRGEAVEDVVAALRSYMK